MANGFHEAGPGGETRAGAVDGFGAGGVTQVRRARREPWRASALALLAALAGLPVAAPAAAQTTDTVFVRLDADGAAHVRQGLLPEDGAVRAFAHPDRAPDAVAGGGGAGRRGAARRRCRADPGRRGVPHRCRLRCAGRRVLHRPEYGPRAVGPGPPSSWPAGRPRRPLYRDVTAPWLIRLEGDPDVLDALDLSTSLPRFVRTGDDVVTATLSSVPRDAPALPRGRALVRAHRRLRGPRAAAGRRDLGRGGTRESAAGAGGTAP